MHSNKNSSRYFHNCRTKKPSAHETIDRNTTFFSQSHSNRQKRQKKRGLSPEKKFLNNLRTGNGKDAQNQGDEGAGMQRAMSSCQLPKLDEQAP